MAWAVGREILDLGLGRGQTTLQEYCDLGCSDPATRGAKDPAAWTESGETGVLLIAGAVLEIHDSV